MIELIDRGDQRPNRRPGRPLQSAADTSFAQALRRTREQLGMTLMQAAERAGVSYAFISELERGRRKPSERTITRLCATLGLEFEPEADRD